MKGRPPHKGFTLVELLIVIIIIALLAAALIVMIAYIIDRAKYEDTIALVKGLDGACTSYRAEFKQFPPVTPYTGSANLHFYLGRQSQVMVQQGSVNAYGAAPLPAQSKTLPPFYYFKPNQLLGSPASTDPNPPAQVVDTWGRALQYSIDAPLSGTQDPSSVSIRSAGANGTMGDQDDVYNHIKEY